MKIAVLSPHRDDAAFSLSLSIAAWIGRGHRVEVINCFTRSDFAPFSDADSVHPNDRPTYVTAVRSKEDESWGRQFGASLRRTDLNLKDAPLRLRCRLDEVATVDIKTADKSLLRIAKALGESGAAAYVLPLALGNHVDHRTAREAALAFAAPLFATLPCAFYEDLPDEVENLEEASRERASALAAQLGTELQPVFASSAVPEAEMAGATARKRRFALCYDSQIDDATAGRIADTCSRYAGRERLWANTAWRESELMS